MADTSLNLQSDYLKLAQEIQKTINKNDSLFQEMQKQSYPSQSTYETDLKNYKINQEIKNVDDTRKELWNILNKKYNDNTNLIKHYYTEITKIDQLLEDQIIEKNDLIDEINNMKSKNQNLIANYKKYKYSINKHNYFMFMYKVLLFFQIISTIILVFGILQLINKNTTFVLVTFIIVGLIFYMFYYIYVINNDRNQFYWDKSRVSDKLINQNSNNAQKRKQDRDKRQKLRNKQELAELDDTINKIVEDSKSNQCAN
tara:strand:+ start:2853 stop:3623 length:771 start_codon:yes stop_codon:yes gene_type:complete